MRERPNTRTEDTVTPQDPPASKTEARKKQKVHSLIDKVYSRKNLELAWEKVKKKRGSAGIDDVTIATFAERQESSTWTSCTASCATGPTSRNR